MPIINSYSVVTSGTGGSNVNSVSSEQPYTESFTGFVTIPANEKFLLIPGKQHAREIVLSFSSEPIELYFGENNIPFETLNILEKYRDNQLGVDLWVKSLVECQCLVVIRSVELIDYIEEDMPIELIVRQIVKTGTAYEIPPLALTTIGDENLRRILDSNNGATEGCKVYALDQFQEGKEYTFAVNHNNVVNLDKPFRILLIKIEDVMKCLASFDASDNEELDQLEISSNLIGWIKSRSHYSEIDLNSVNTFTLKPSRTRYLLAFDCGNPDSSDYTDTAISTYQANTSNIYEGGTFTIQGF